MKLKGIDEKVYAFFGFGNCVWIADMNELNAKCM